MTIGERIALARKAKGWTQTELGEKVGLAGTGVSSIEGGKSQSTESINALIGCFPAGWRNWIETEEGEKPKGVLVPIRKGMDENPWRDALVQQLKSDLEDAKEQIRFLRAMVAKEKGVNFLEASSSAVERQLNPIDFGQLEFDWGHARA